MAGLVARRVIGFLGDPPCGDSKETVRRGFPLPLAPAILTNRLHSQIIGIRGGTVWVEGR